MGYTKDAGKGVSWITLLRVSTRVITLIRFAILGRLLTQVQFGYYGIATLFLSLLEILTETGVNVFLVQEKGNIKEYINSAWAVSIIRGIILSLIILLSASFIATFFNSPEAYFVIVLIAVVPFIRGFINPAIITYQKELLFHKEFRFRFVLFLIDVIVSVIAGIISRSAESFIYGLIASALLEVLLSYILIPIWPQLKFEYEKIKKVIRKGWWVTATGICSYFADNGDNMVVGKILGSASLGVYQIAYKFSTLPISEITNVVNQVVFPIYAKFPDDKDRLWKALLKVTMFSSIAAFIFGGSIFVFAKPIIFFIMGVQWLGAVPVIQILSIYGILRTIFGNFSPFFLSVGKQDYVAKMTLLRMISLLVLVVPFVLKFGMLGAGYAMLLSILIEIPILLFFSYKIFNNK